MEFTTQEMKTVAKLCAKLEPIYDRAIIECGALNKQKVSEELERQIYAVTRSIQDLRSALAHLEGLEDVSLEDFLYKYPDGKEKFAWQTKNLQNALDLCNRKMNLYGERDQLGFQKLFIFEHHPFFSPMVENDTLFISEDTPWTLPKATKDRLYDSLCAVLDEAVERDDGKTPSEKWGLYNTRDCIKSILYNNRLDGIHEVDRIDWRFIVITDDDVIRAWQDILNNRYGVRCFICSRGIYDTMRKAESNIPRLEWFKMIEKTYFFSKVEFNRQMQISHKARKDFVEKRAIEKFNNAYNAVKAQNKELSNKYNSVTGEYLSVLKQVKEVFDKKFGFASKEIFESYKLSQIIKNMNNGASYLEAIRIYDQDMHNLIMQSAQYEAHKKLEEEAKKQTRYAAEAAKNAKEAAENAQKAIEIENERKQLEEEYQRRLDEIQKKQRELEKKL